MTDTPRVELVAAGLRRDLEDLDMYAQFLQNTLEFALPGGLLEVERRQSLADRLKKRPGTVIELAVTLGDQRYVLHPHRGAPRAQIVHVVRGLELDHEGVTLDVWVHQLAQALMKHAKTHARTAAVLARVTDPSGSLD